MLNKCKEIIKSKTRKIPPKECRNYAMDNGYCKNHGGESYIPVFGEPLTFTFVQCERYKRALEKIIEREKPSPDNDPLGMGIVNESYRIAKEALDGTLERN